MKDKIKNKTLGEFGILIGILFPLIIGLIIPLITGHTFRIWTLYIGIPLIILGFTKPKMLFYPYKIWMKLGLILGWINSHIILAIVFILVLLPIAIFMKIFGYDPLRKKINASVSYREITKNNQINFEKIF